MTRAFGFALVMVIGLATLAAPAQAQSHLRPSAADQVAPKAVAAVKKGTVTIQVPGAPRAGKRFLVRGSAPRKSRILVAARKPGTKHWTTIGQSRANGGGNWRARVRLGPGGWQVAARSSGKSASTEALVAGRTHKAVLRSAADELTAGQIESVSGDPNVSQTVVVRQKSQLPTVGDVLVADASRNSPNGLLGKVVAVDPSALTAVIEPAALSQAYSTLEVSAASTLGRLVQDEGTASAALSSVPVQFKCSSTVSGSTLPTLTAHLDMSSMRASFDMNLKRRYVDLLISGQPTLEAGLSWDAALQAGCQASISVPPIPLGPTGLTLNLTPAIEASMQSGGAATLTGTARAGMTVGFSVSGSKVAYTRGAGVRVEWPQLATSRQATFELALNDEVALMVAGRVGIFGSFGPVLDAGISQSGAQSCLDIAGALQVGFGLKADLFITDWKVDLAKTKLTLGHLYKKCVNATSTSSASALLEEVNQARSVAQWCGTTRYDARPPLAPQAQLTAAAQGWAEEIASGRQPLGHYSNDGRGPEARAAAAGYIPPEGTSVGENVAGGFLSAKDVVYAWLGSPGHCAGMMKAIDFAGVGQVRGVWVADFKCPVCATGSAPSAATEDGSIQSASSMIQDSAGVHVAGSSMSRSHTERREAESAH